MTLEVVSLEGRRPRDEDRADQVRILEEFLERARRGEYLNLAVVAVRNNMTAEHESSGGDGYTALIGGVFHLGHRLIGGS